jgi:hypothetical protein
MVVVVTTVLSYLIDKSDRGPALRHKAARAARKRKTHPPHSSIPLAYLSWYQMERSRYPQRFRALLHIVIHPAHFCRLLKFYQEDIVQRHNPRSYGIVLVRNRVSSPFNPPLFLAYLYVLIEMLA